MAAAALTSVTSLNSSATKFEDLGANRAMSVALTTVSATLSMLGSLIMTMFIAWEGVPSTSRRILLYISVADFLIAGSNLYGLWREKYSESECRIQSFVTTCASLCSFFWTTFLAVFMYVTVVQRKTSTAQKMLRGFFSFGWGIPFALTGVAFGENALGTHGVLYSAGWCWISSTAANKNMWMWLTGKAWEIAAYILISIFYGLLKYHIRREVHHRQKQFTTQKEMKDALKAERRLTFVPVIFILLRIWGTVRFITFTYTNTSTNNKALDVMLYLQGIGDSGQGFANFILFCLLTEKFQFHLRRMAYKCVPCLKRQPNVLLPRTAASAPIQQDDFGETTPLLET